MSEQLIDKKYDLVIIGGGTSGITCAIAGAKQGLKVAIIEKNITLSGTQGNALVTPFMPTNQPLSNSGRLILDTYRLKEDESFKVDFEETLSFNPETYIRVVEKICLELDIDIYFNATVYEVEREEAKVAAIKFHFLGNNYKLTGKTYADGSGDLIIPRLIGLKCFKGDSDGKNQSLSLRFEVGGISLSKLKTFLKEKNYLFSTLNKEYLEFVSVPGLTSCEGLNKVFEEGVERGELAPEDIRYIQGFTTPGTKNLLSFNCPQLPNNYDISNPLAYSQGVIKGRVMQERLIKFMKGNIPGFEGAYITKSAPMLGIRESYRLKAEYIMGESDYLERVKFADGIARGDWYIDVHSDCEGVEDDSYKSHYEVGEYYEIPYRSLITRELQNVIFIGRHIGTTYLMQSSIRIQHTVMALGEAGAIAAKQAITNGDNNFLKVDGKKLKELILK